MARAIWSGVISFGLATAGRRHRQFPGRGEIPRPGNHGGRAP
jgi:hypothetical protein